VHNIKFCARKELFFICTIIILKKKKNIKYSEDGRANYDVIT